MKKLTRQEKGKLIGSVLNLATVILRAFHDKTVADRLNSLERRVVELEMTRDYPLN